MKRFDREYYERQTEILLRDALPAVAEEDCFAMHGGTAINYFVRDMPRLSVDIDLTYIEIAERGETLDRMNEALARIGARIRSGSPSMWIRHRTNVCKLLVGKPSVKVEVNLVGRGLLGEARTMPLCEAARRRFDASCDMPIVSDGQLYGSKLSAALERQHPRDLFDVKLMLDGEGYTDEIRRGFMFALAGGSRPTHETLDPQLHDRRQSFEDQFKGMAMIDFSHDDFEETRRRLIRAVRDGLDDDDRAFLLSLNRLEPDWSVHDYRRFPAVRWKLMNLEKFRRDAPDRYHHQFAALTAALEK